MFRLEYGGRIVEKWPVKADDYSANYVWDKGNILTKDSDGNAQIAPVNSTGPFGIALERRQAPIGDDTTPDETYLAGVVSVITGESVGLTDDLTSGVTFAVNDKLYTDGGKFTNGAGTGSVVARVREVKADGSLEIFFRPADI